MSGKMTPFVVTAAGLACLMAAGCRYQAGALIPAGVRSVHVEVIRNDTVWREAFKADNLDTAMPPATPRPAFTMELDLTTQLKNEVVRRTPLKLAGRKTADSILKASIVAVAPKSRFRDAEDQVLAQRVSIRVDFEWVERATGRVMAEGKGVSRPTDFVTHRGENFTTAARKSFGHIAKQIVERMQEGF